MFHRSRSREPSNPKIVIHEDGSVEFFEPFLYSEEFLSKLSQHASIRYQKHKLTEDRKTPFGPAANTAKNPTRNPPRSPQKKRIYKVILNNVPTKKR